MSVVLIRAALETALAAMTPALSTAYENTPFTPIAGTPYQRVWFLDFLTQTLELGGHMHRVRSYFQIDLMYPLQIGTAASAARGELISATFKAGATFSSGGILVLIPTTPVIGGGYVEGDRWKSVVKIDYAADIYH